MYIHDDIVGGAAQIFQYVTDRLKRAVQGGQEHAAGDIDYGDILTKPGFVDMIALPGARAGIVSRPYQTGFIVNKSKYVFVIPYMIAHGQHIDAGTQ